MCQGHQPGQEKTFFFRHSCLSQSSPLPPTPLDLAKTQANSFENRDKVIKFHTKQQQNPQQWIGMKENI